MNVARILRRHCSFWISSAKRAEIYCYKMTSNGDLVVDRSKFKKEVTVPYLTLEKKTMERIMPFVRTLLFKAVKFNPVLDEEVDGSSEYKQVLLDPIKVKEMQDLGQELIKKLKDFNLSTELNHKTFELTYDNLTAEAVLKTVLPPEVALSSWSTIGHILHLNLREELLPYKTLIGQVLLDKNQPAIKLVVNKTNNIDNEFRNLQMEILAQKEESVSTLVEVNESNCRFKFDFAKVYWNPRLSTEHERILNKLRQGMDVLYDVFAGVGPFSVPAAKRRCKSVANDLNPESFKWMQENAKINKVTDLHSCFNLDGRDFIREVIKKDIIKEWKDFSSGEESRVKKFHIVMNLPGLAVEFLDSFVGWLSQEENEIRSFKDFSLPIIHCYSFVKGMDREENKKKLVEIAGIILQTDLSSSIEEVQFVRNVAPNKDMFRLTFNLPEEVAFAKLHKKRKTESE